MKNKCKNCGKCCLNTEMIINFQDLNLILKSNLLNNLTKEEIVFKNENGNFQLKNINGHCVFFSISSKTCKIYNIRPQGCRFYPLIYDLDENKCNFDLDCPRTHLFYQNNREFKKTCEKLKKFIVIIQENSSL